MAVLAAREGPTNVQTVSTLARVAEEGEGVMDKHPTGPHRMMDDCIPWCKEAVPAETWDGAKIQTLDERFDAASRYRNDPHFHMLVNVLMAQIKLGEYTPSELRLALIFAATEVEAQRTRTYYHRNVNL